MKGNGAGIGKVQSETEKCFIEINRGTVTTQVIYTKIQLENGFKEIVLELYENVLNTLKHIDLPVDSLLYWYET